MIAKVLTAAAVVAAAWAAVPSDGLAQQPARDTVRVTGSSTLYGFATRVAERFGRATPHRTPVVESSGTGGGMARFCAGIGMNTPDITLASRRILDSEIAACHDNSVDQITEFKIGYGGLVVVQPTDAEKLELSRRDLWLALAAEVPVDGHMVPNPNTLWTHVDKDLPSTPIRVYGPPPTSGTRDSLMQLALEPACRADSYVSGLPEADQRRVCGQLREDGAYINVKEDDAELIKRVANDGESAGVLGLQSALHAGGRLQYASMSGALPSGETIRTGEYPLIRALYFYVKDDHLGRVSGLKDYVQSFVSTAAIGPEGYLVEEGLIPLAPTELEDMQARALNLPEG
ncbi:substrate-binding domain-containing protein [Caenispirillum salinarum]|uniref:substrate-binding domain-containing protein n=1 Tax=Caenispirillum salinarum TaxID=859058 RepID=UPI00384C0235